MTAENAAAFPEPKPTVPVDRVVDRIVKETLNAVEASKPDETPPIKSWTDAAVALVNQHPSKLNLISWLALQALEDRLSSDSSERGLDYVMEIGSPDIEATEADVQHSEAMIEEFEEFRRARKTQTS